MDVVGARVIRNRSSQRDPQHKEIVSEQYKMSLLSHFFSICGMGNSAWVCLSHTFCVGLFPDDQSSPQQPPDLPVRGLDQVLESSEHRAKPAPHLLSYQCSLWLLCTWGPWSLLTWATGNALTLVLGPRVGCPKVSQQHIILN